jgi:D-alanine transfer protein
MRKTNYSYLKACGAAILLIFCLTIIVRALVAQWELRYLDQLATAGDDEVVKGLSLTRQALRQPDRLLLIGSSELTMQDEFHAARLFATKPTGFSVYIIGSGYRQSIHNFVTLAALGADLKGKKVVLFVTPTWFGNEISETAYNKNFSLLQAYEFAFNSPLSPKLKQRAARRLLQLKSPGTDNTVLRATLQAYADGDNWAAIRKVALWPVGEEAIQYLRLKDEIQLARLILTKNLKPGTKPAQPAPVDWEKLLAQADLEARASTSSNTFGMQDSFYVKQVGPRLEKLRDSAVGESWLQSTEYGDMTLVMDTLRELGAQPLFVSLPVMGSYYDFKGFKAADRAMYYSHLKGIIHDAGFPVVDFGSKEYELGFMRDPWHPGWKGSVYIAQTIDQFYHGHLSAADH